MDDATLGGKASEAIQNGKLPMENPLRIMGGPGCGQPCALCGDIVQRDRMELEPEFIEDRGVSEGQKYHLHPRCFIAWESAGKAALSSASMESAAQTALRVVMFCAEVRKLVVDARSRSERNAKHFAKTQFTVLRNKTRVAQNRRSLEALRKHPPL